MRWAWAIVVGSIGSALGGACSEDVPASEPAPTDETYADSDCGVCFASQCAAEVEACGADPSCAAYYLCLSDCPVDRFGNADPACDAACPAADSDTTQELKGKLTLCRYDTAGPACGCQLSLRGQQCAASEETNSCWKCEEERCCDTMAACRDDAECSALVECLKSCPVESPNCSADCAVTHEAAMPLLGQRLGCIYQECNTECGGDDCTECIGQHCGESYTACNSQVDCWSLNDCVSLCGDDPTCVQSCLDSHPEASDSFWYWSYCASHYCSC